MTEQAQRHLPPHGSFVGGFFEHGDAVLQVLLSGGHDELEHGVAFLAVSGQRQARAIFAPPFRAVSPTRQRQQRLFGDGAEPVGHLLAPSAAGGEVAQEGPDLRQLRTSEGCFDAVRASVREAEKKGHEDGGETAGDYGHQQKRGEERPEGRAEAEIESGCLDPGSAAGRPRAPL